MSTVFEKGFAGYVGLDLRHQRLLKQMRFTSRNIYTLSSDSSYECACVVNDLMQYGLVRLVFGTPHLGLAGGLIYGTVKLTKRGRDAMDWKAPAVAGKVAA